MASGEPDLRAVQQLIAQIYDAALHPAAWEDALVGLRDHLQADSAAILLHDLPRRASLFWDTVGLDARTLDPYFEYYAFREPSFLFRLGRPEGEPTASHLVMPDAEFAETEFYRDYLRRLGLFYTAGAQVLREDDNLGTFGVQRARRHGPFDGDALRTIALIAPHVRRALQIRRRVARETLARQSLLTLLEALPTGVVLLNARGRAAFVNDRAEAILAAESGLAITLEGIVATDPKIDAKLQRCVADAVATGAGRSLGAGGAVRLSGADGSASCQVLVTPLRVERSRMDFGTESICAALFLQLAGPSPDLALPLLQELFALTPAEARVAAGLVQGRSPEEIAADGEITRHTVRSQLSSLYNKLGVHRQAEVVQRVLSSPAVLVPPDDDPQR